MWTGPTGPSHAGKRAAGVEGFSMGGHGAAYLGFKYPELFGVVSVLSGALHQCRECRGRWGTRGSGVW